MQNQAVICGGLYHKPRPNPQASNKCFVIGTMSSASMATARWEAASLSYQGRMLVAGGEDENQDKTQSMEWVSLESSGRLTSSPAGEMPVAV